MFFFQRRFSVIPNFNQFVDLYFRKMKRNEILTADIDITTVVLLNNMWSSFVIVTDLTDMSIQQGEGYSCPTQCHAPYRKFTPKKQKNFSYSRKRKQHSFFLTRVCSCMNNTISVVSLVYRKNCPLIFKKDFVEK